MSDSNSTATDSKKVSSKRWFPLESNPEVMNKFITQLGFSTGEYCLTDVFSTEEWALDMVPKPVLGVVFLYPLTEKSELFSAEEKARIEQDGQHISPNVYYMKQTVGNACGTVGLLHAIGNIRKLHDGNLLGPEDSYLRTFYKNTESMNPDEIADYLMNDDALESFHGSSAQEGQTEAHDDVNKHFIAFTHVDGHLYELDGRKAFPINHGETSPETLLADACRVIQGFFNRDPEEVGFTIMALAGLQEM